MRVAGDILDLVAALLAVCAIGLVTCLLMAILNWIRDRFAERALRKKVPRGARMTQQQHSDFLERLRASSAKPTDIFMSVAAANRLRQMHGLPPLDFCEHCNSDPCQCKPQAAE